MKLSDTALISDLHENLFSILREPEKWFQVMSEGEALIVNKNSTGTRFDKKMANNDSK